MIHFFNKHWQNILFSLATFFWVGCSDESSTTAAPLYGCPNEVCGNENTDVSSSSSSVPNTSSSIPDTSSSGPGTSSSVPDTTNTSSAFDSSSSNYDPDNWIPPMSSTAYGIQPTYNKSSSSSHKMSSSSSYDDSKIPRMSSTAYGIEPCYSTTIQNDDGVTFDIFECSNGKKYLQDGYDESLKDALPEGVETTPLVKSGRLAMNCTQKRTCADDSNAEGTNADECTTTLECPPKE